MNTIYSEIAARTAGNIYIGVVGPVRTGKSTFIKRMMEQLVIPCIEDPYRRERAKDELPQSGSGRTIMTSEPKFIPEEAVEISPDGTTVLRIRMIDSVGYMVEGAVGADEDGIPRMVTTPWFDYEIPMTDAAELGTQKVMQEHCSIGLVITTDGSIADIQRQDYVDAEKRAIEDMAATGKPYLVIINSKDPGSDSAKAVKRNIQESYGIEPVLTDCQAMTIEDIAKLLTSLLYAFPVGAISVRLPRWMDGLDMDHPLKAEIYGALKGAAGKIRTLSQAETMLSQLSELENIFDCSVKNIDPASGTVYCALQLPDRLFYEILSQRTGIALHNDAQLMQLLTELSEVKKQYDQISDALSSVHATGYGIVMPTPEQMRLQKPEIIHKNGAYGVKLKAEASSIHMIRVDIDTQISPTVGDEKQSQELIEYLTGEDPQQLWESNIFGKTVYTLIRDGLNTKLTSTADEVKAKFRSTLTRVVNEGATGLICLIL